MDPAQPVQPKQPEQPPLQLPGSKYAETPIFGFFVRIHIGLSKQIEAVAQRINTVAEEATSEQTTISNIPKTVFKPVLDPNSYKITKFFQILWYSIRSKIAISKPKPQKQPEATKTPQKPELTKLQQQPETSTSPTITPPEPKKKELEAQPQRQPTPLSATKTPPKLDGKKTDTPQTQEKVQPSPLRTVADTSTKEPASKPDPSPTRSTYSPEEKKEVPVAKITSAQSLPKIANPGCLCYFISTITSLWASKEFRKKLEEIPEKNRLQQALYDVFKQLDSTETTETLTFPSSPSYQELPETQPHQEPPLHVLHREVSRLFSQVMQYSAPQDMGELILTLVPQLFDETTEFTMHSSIAHSKNESFFEKIPDPIAMPRFELRSTIQIPLKEVRDQPSIQDFFSEHTYTETHNIQEFINRISVAIYQGQTAQLEDAGFDVEEANKILLKTFNNLLEKNGIELSEDQLSELNTTFCTLRNSDSREIFIAMCEALLPQLQKTIKFQVFKTLLTQNGINLSPDQLSGLETKFLDLPDNDSKKDFKQLLRILLPELQQPFKFQVFKTLLTQNGIKLSDDQLSGLETKFLTQTDNDLEKNFKQMLNFLPPELQKTINKQWNTIWERTLLRALWENVFLQTMLNKEDFEKLCKNSGIPQPIEDSGSIKYRATHSLSGPLPKFLPITLARISAVGKPVKFFKDQSPITIQKTISIPVVGQKEPTEYRLVSASLHTGGKDGTIDSGHYFTMVWEEAERQWIYISDDSDRKVLPEKVGDKDIQTDGVFFLYEKIEK